MKRLRRLTILPLLALPLAAHAGGLGTDFNAMVFGGASTNGGHADGAVGVGGSWAGSGYDVLQHAKPGAMGGYRNVGMVVGGSVAYGNGGSINNSGTAHVGGSFTTQNPYNVNGGRLYVGGSTTGPINGAVTKGTNTVPTDFFSSQRAYSLGQSAAIKALNGTAINTSDPNNWRLSVTSGLNVFTIKGSDLHGNRTLDISGITATSTLLINVTGAASIDHFGITVNSNTGTYDKILWNFADVAGTINIDNRALHGSILAPKATVNQYQNIDGQLIAANWNNYHNAELHMVGFTGAAPVPEPASMLALGLGAAAMLRRRKRD